MSIYLESVGQGKDLVFLHGWGFNAEVWRGLAECLSKKFRCHLLDLPGYARSQVDNSFNDLQSMAKALNAVLPPQYYLLGWSLGGMIAMQMALLFPKNVQRLILVATNAKFVSGEHWQSGIKPEILSAFAGQLGHDFRKTLKQFLLLQTKGLKDAREQVRKFEPLLFQLGEPDIKTLQAGLRLLQTGDLTPHLPALTTPTLLVNGRLDSLVPQTAGENMVSAMPDARLHVFPHSAHMPFVSDAEDFMRLIENFLSQDAA